MKITKLSRALPLCIKNDGWLLESDVDSERTKEWFEVFPHDIPLIISDCPYGNIIDIGWDEALDQSHHAQWMVRWVRTYSQFLPPGGSFMVWQGTGKRNFRPFYEFASRIEQDCPDLQIKNHITWAKKRAYGVSDNYLYTREELLWLKKDGGKGTFNIPLLEQERGYEGFSKKYPAKSKFLRRTNVWTDITEIFKGKHHPTEKALKLYKVLIETHTKPGDWVLDLFSGSGVAAFAAKELGRKFILVEKDPAYNRDFEKRYMEKFYP